MSPDFPILTFTPWYPVRKNTAKQPFRVILVCLKINDGLENNVERRNCIICRAIERWVNIHTLSVEIRYYGWCLKQPPKWDAL